MKDHFNEEKELLIMKGNALRLKLQRQAINTNKTITNPINQFKRVSGSVFTPILLALAKRHLFTKRNIAYSVLGLTSIYLLAKRNKD